jgi:hypothetical protein
METSDAFTQSQNSSQFILGESISTFASSPANVTSFGVVVMFFISQFFEHFIVNSSL